MKFFEIKSGSVCVKDPCYEGEMNTISHVKNGQWIGSVEMLNAGPWGSRVQTLIAMHKEYDFAISDPEWTQITEFGVDVDSGQAGIVDSSSAELTAVEDYDSICSLSSSKDNFGVNDYGVFSFSGYGDGSYTCSVIKMNGTVVAIKIDYLFDNDVEQFDEDVEYEFPDYKEFED